MSGNIYLLEENSIHYLCRDQLLKWFAWWESSE
jgi:hypothetical protein